MDNQLHYAVQYLAAAAGSYIDHQPDDSHANLGWDGKHGVFVSRALNDKGLMLAINTKAYSIEFKNEEGKTTSGLGLENSSHNEIVQWIADFAKLKGIDIPFQWKFNYKLPYHKELNYVFPKADVVEIERLNTMRTQAAEAMTAAFSGFTGVSEQRVWPHHFDLGLLIDKSNGKEGNTNAYYVGLAIPDDLVDDHYLYVNPWIEGADLDLSTLPKLEEGDWLNGDWKGAVVKYSRLSTESTIRFLRKSVALMDPFFN